MDNNNTIAILNIWPRFMDLNLASKYTGFSKSQIYRFINRGDLSVIKIRGGDTRLDREDIDKFFLKNKKNIRSQLIKNLEK